MSQKIVAKTPITHGLIIDQPWIVYILQGGKTWELRSTACSRTGPVALIRKVSKTIVGFAHFTGAKGPLSKSDLIHHLDDHCVPAERILQDDYKWLYAWTQEQVVALDEPIPYIHKNGAVIWIELDDNAKRLIQPHLDDYFSVISVHDVHQSTAEVGHDVDGLLKPIARDGTIFCPEFCCRNGADTVGSKGVEQRFSRFSDIRKIPTARWRKPNKNGLWGIVSAVV